MFAINKDYSKISVINKAVPDQGALRLDVWLDMFMRIAASARERSRKDLAGACWSGGTLNISPLGEIGLIKVELAGWLEAQGRHVTGITVRSYRGRVVGGKVRFLSRLFSIQPELTAGCERGTTKHETQSLKKSGAYEADACDVAQHSRVRGGPATGNRPAITIYNMDLKLTAAANDFFFS